MITSDGIGKVTYQVELLEAKRKEPPNRRHNRRPNVVASEGIEGENRVVMVGEVLPRQNHCNVGCKK